ncbi:MAG: rhodanese-like domain-containing protein [Syntrophobacteraceae bacterium]
MRKGIPGKIKLVAEILFTILLAAPLFPSVARPAPGPDIGIIEPVDLNKTMQTWTVLDARLKPEWQAGHIAGARSFSWEDYLKTDETGTPFRQRPAPEVAEALSRMGVDENRPVVVYGDADKSWGGEGWACWVLAWMGHKGPIRLLAGGIQAWKAQGFPVSSDPPKVGPTAARYRVSLRPELDIQALEIEEKGGALVLIDTRSTMEWLTGRIPGAIHIPWTEFYTGKDRRPITPAALQKLLKDNGVKLDKPIVYYCAAGVRSGYAWAVHTAGGLPAARNYKAGWEDWKRRTSK